MQILRLLQKIPAVEGLRDSELQVRLTMKALSNTINILLASGESELEDQIDRVVLQAVGRVASAILEDLGHAAIAAMAALLDRLDAGSAETASMVHVRNQVVFLQEKVGQLLDTMTAQLQSVRQGEMNALAGYDGLDKDLQDLMRICGNFAADDVEIVVTFIKAVADLAHRKRLEVL
jgi:hypothetical protein